MNDREVLEALYATVENRRDNTVDAHSLMGFFAIDEKIPIELLLESEPDNNLKQAISKFAFVNA